MNAEMSRPSSGRIAYLDALRILCSFLVIVNHTYSYIGLDRASSSVRFASFLALFASKIAVPVFLMISGCTLLTKTDSIAKTLRRFLRIAVSLVVFSFIYEAYGYACGNIETLSVKRFLHSIYTVHITPAYWYLYMYAGMLLMVPFLQRMVKGMSRSDFLFFFAVSLFFIGLWPMIVEYTPVSDDYARFELPLFGAHICYMLLGYFVYTQPQRRIPLSALILLPLLSISACALVTHRAFAASGGARYLFLDNIALLPVALTSVCVFSLAARIPLHGRIADCARHLGNCAFGVYLLGDLTIAMLFPLLYVFLDALHPLLAVALYQAASWLLALAFTAVLKRIPLIGRLL